MKWFLVTLALLTAPVYSIPPLLTVDISAEDAAGAWSGPDGKGYANDVVSAAFMAAGVVANIHVVPYSICKKRVIDGTTVACFSMAWESPLAPYVVFADRPLFNANVQVYKRKGFVGEASLGALPKSATLGVVVDYEYPKDVADLIATGVKVHRAKDELALLKALASGNTDYSVLVVDGLKPASMLMQEAGVSGSLVLAFRDGVQGSYVGFSRRNPRGEWALAKFNEGYSAITLNGKLKAIIAHWGINPQLK